MESQSSDTVSQAITILIVDDVEPNRILLDRILTPRGYRTLIACGGAEAVTLATSELPDLVLMDLQMPEVDGYQALRQLRSDDLTRVIPVVAITGNALQQDEERINRAGFDDYLFKPYQIKDLLNIVSAQLQNRASD